MIVHGVSSEGVVGGEGGKGRRGDAKRHGDTEHLARRGRGDAGRWRCREKRFGIGWEAIGSAVEKFDRVDDAVAAVVTRKDAAKSLWTTVIGTIWQAVWAVIGFVIGLPKEVWIVVAVIAAALMFLFCTGK